MSYLDRARLLTPPPTSLTKREEERESNATEERECVPKSVAGYECDELSQRSRGKWSPLVLERKDDLVRLRGVRGWVNVADLTPCRDCGGTRFAIGKGRLFCHRCLPPKIGEKVAGYIDVTQVK